jgi:hypothetical protein
LACDFISKSVWKTYCWVAQWITSVSKGRKQGVWLKIRCTRDVIMCSLANQCQVAEGPSDAMKLFTFRSTAFVPAC